MLHSRTQLLALALVLASAGSAHADIWQVGDVITYPQTLWGGSLMNPGAQLVFSDFQSVYAPSDLLIVGNPNTGLTMTFDAGPQVIAYLPAIQPPGMPLKNSVVDPTITPSGEFGGDVLALQLNVDFSDAGFLLGTSGLHFGDLVLQNLSLPALNGVTVHQFLADANTALGGGAPIYDLVTLDNLAVAINASFANGSPGGFAQTSLARPTVSAVPEPSSWLLLLSVVVGLAWTRGWFRRSARRSS
jgi:hypothetical protein